MFTFILEKVQAGALPCQLMTVNESTFGFDAVFRWFPYHNSQRHREQMFFNVALEEVQACINFLGNCYREGVFKKF